MKNRHKNFKQDGIPESIRLRAKSLLSDGFQQKDVAEQLGISRTAVSRIANNIVGKYVPKGREKKSIPAYAGLSERSQELLHNWGRDCLN